jgi:hypothetical protein
MAESVLKNNLPFLGHKINRGGKIVGGNPFLKE